MKGRRKPRPNKATRKPIKARSRTRRAPRPAGFLRGRRFRIEIVAAQQQPSGQQQQPVADPESEIVDHDPGLHAPESIAGLSAGS